MSVRFKSVKTLEMSVSTRFPNGVPEVLDAVLGASAETRAEDDVRPAGLDRPQQQRVLGRVVLEVRVLDQQDLAPAPPDRRPDRPPLALVRLVEDDPNAFAPVPRLEDLARAVGRGVVHDDDLLLDRHRGDEPEDLVDRARLVVDGDQDGELHGFLA